MCVYKGEGIAYRWVPEVSLWYHSSSGAIYCFWRQFLTDLRLLLIWIGSYPKLPLKHLTEPVLSLSSINNCFIVTRCPAKTILLTVLSHENVTLDGAALK